MPTYQYSCSECGHFFEIFQSFSDDSLTVCPECEGKLRKVFNAVGVVFKGSGFYRNDSREQKTSAGSGSSSSSSDGSGASASGNGSGSSSDSGASKSSEKSDSSTKGSEKTSGSTTSTPSPA